MTEIQMTIEELEKILNDQKEEVAKHITRNLSCYHWWGITGVDSEKARKELKTEALKSEYPNDYLVLNKYMKRD